MIKTIGLLLIATFANSSVLAFLPSHTPQNRWRTSQFAKENDEEKVNAPGHGVRPSGPVPDLTVEEQERLQAQAQLFMEYQQEAPKLDWPTEVRTLVQVRRVVQ